VDLLDRHQPHAQLAIRPWLNLPRYQWSSGRGLSQGQRNLRGWREPSNIDDARSTNALREADRNRGGCRASGEAYPCVLVSICDSQPGRHHERGFYLAPAVVGSKEIAPGVGEVVMRTVQTGLRFPSSVC
jgi:hypothetical protein